MDRTTARILIDQLCRELPDADPDDFDYGWFRERVAAVADRCPATDRAFVWQWALWHLDAAGLMPEELAPRFEV